MSDGLTRGEIPRAALALGLAGLIPFAAGALSLWLPLGPLTPDHGLKLAISYGAIILSFLGGIRWGTAIGPYDAGRQSREFAASVLGSLAGLAAIFLPSVPALTLLVAGFLMQALWDVTSVEAGRLPSWFGKLRMLLTAGAVVSLIAALVAVVVT
ncbi:DUF3429 domain-containing protein [Aestuariivirga sp.]|uniref:DUF3429 domain-containing protein n=1 Tax=Aestuariivirga sp. TaxID=2650926 RepID=UPI003593B706